MSRCNTCFSIVTKSDTDCYVCGEALPERTRWIARFRFWAKPGLPVLKTRTRNALVERLQEVPAASQWKSQ